MHLPCSRALAPRAARATHLGATHLGATRLGATHLGATRLGATRLGATRLGSFRCRCWRLLIAARRRCRPLLSCAARPAPGALRQRLLLLLLQLLQLQLLLLLQLLQLLLLLPLQLLQLLLPPLLLLLLLLLPRRAAARAPRHGRAREPFRAAELARGAVQRAGQLDLHPDRLEIAPAMATSTSTSVGSVGSTFGGGSLAHPRQWHCLFH